MPKTTKFSPDGGQTIYDLSDSQAVHWSESQGYVGKNRFKPTALPQTKNGVTWTFDNNDNSWVANGTAANNSALIVGIADKIDGVVTISGCPSGGTGSTYEIQVVIDGTYANYHEYGSGNLTMTLSSEHTYELACIVRNGYAANNLVFKPMIRLSSISDSTYEPYLTPNTEIDNKLSYADNAVLGAKNLLKCTGVTTTHNGVTFTVNSDGTISTSGTASGGRAKLVYQVYYYGESNPYLTGCPSGGGSNYWIDLYDYDTLTNNNEYGSGATTTIANGHKIDININVAEGTNSNGLVFKPMLRLATDTDNTYVPYAMTNKELTDKVTQSLEDVTTTFKNEVVVSGSTITNVEWARKIRYGNILIFQARVNKAANTKINQNLNCPLTFPETFLSNSLLTMASASNATTATFDKTDKKISFRYDTSDGTTYVDLQMIAIIV